MLHLSVQSNPGKTCARPHAEYTAPASQHELERTDHESTCPERSTVALYIIKWGSVRCLQLTISTPRPNTMHGRFPPPPPQGANCLPIRPRRKLYTEYKPTKDAIVLDILSKLSVYPNTANFQFIGRSNFRCVEKWIDQSIGYA